MVKLRHAGRMRIYGENPFRARLALEGFTWGCPVMQNDVSKYTLIPFEDMLISVL